MPLPEFGGTLGPKRAAHLLRRATFGGNKNKIIEFGNMTPSAAITQLFHIAIPDPVLPIDPKTGSEWVLSGITSANSKEGDLDRFFIGWFVAQMMSPGIDPSTNQWLAYAAREKLVFFLHSHFTAIREKVNSSRALYFQNQLYRMFALDQSSGDPDVNFKTLTVKVSVDNAMLRLLDGNLNVRGSVNENYARELLELYTIGRGLESNPPPTSGDPGDYGVYTENDVKTAARILSGWDFDNDFANIDPDTMLPRGKVKGSPTNASAHDNESDPPKQFSNRFVSTLFPDNIIAPDPLLMPGGLPTEESAIDEIEKLVDLIYEQPETARNICRKIYRFFVWGPHTDAEVTASEAVIAIMANDFRTNGFKIQPIIENLLRSQHFYEAAGAPSDVGDDHFGSIIKSPLDLTLGTLRFLGIQLPDMQTQPAEFYAATDHLLSWMELQAMKVYEPYDVAGYDAYHQYPIYHRYWITPNTLTQRYDFVRQIINQTDPVFNNFDVVQFVQNNFAAEAPSAVPFVTAMVTYLFPNLDVPPNTLTTERLNYFVSKILNGFPDGYYWTVTNMDDKRSFFRSFFNALLQSPEYQLS